MRLIEALRRRVEQGLLLARPELGVAIGLGVEEADLLVGEGELIVGHRQRIGDLVQVGDRGGLRRPLR